LLLVRHGESTWNAAGRWQGHADPPLSTTGMSQARAAAPAVVDVRVVWCSDLVRARHTAELCAPAGVVVQAEPLLRERHVGAWTGLTRDTIEDRYPGWIVDGRRPDGWEHDDQVAARAWQALRRIVDTLEPGVAALVVSHGGLIRAVEASLGGRPRPIPNLGGVWLHETAGTFDLGASVALVEGARAAASTVTSPE
ncbi:MAG TPA: histidine phosphatase family protein, partial [Acidimicrobiia bacterium]|nr:histidine phosphatase family protein [Acidimicrobiia bacterium]